MNHYQNCKEEVKAYLESIKNVGVHRANIGTTNDKSKPRRDINQTNVLSQPV